MVKYLILKNKSELSPVKHNYLYGLLIDNNKYSTKYMNFKEKHHFEQQHFNSKSLGLEKSSEDKMLLFKYQIYIQSNF